jgi:hypothetical protein
MPKILGDIKTEQIRADLSKVVDRISKQYDNPDIALQKEAIQNSWDVREDKKEGKGWSFKIYEYKDRGGKIHIVVEDFGTKGMNNKRWEAFASLWHPEKEREDVGGKGQGKFVLMSASRECALFVESISKETGYRCGLLQNERKSSETETISISDYIPGVKKLDHQGTKIWIYDVREELLKVLHSREFIDSIAESWWQILGPRFGAKMTIFGREVTCPILPTPVEELTLLENQQINGLGRIKRLYLGFYTEKVPIAFEGVRIQRANMMILKIPFEVHDKEYQGRFSGYVEFDDVLEEELKGIERNDHCNFLHESPWKEIRTLVKDEVDKFVSKIVPSKEQRKNINIKNLSEVIQKANQIIDEYCPEILGGGTVVPPITPTPRPPIRIKSLNLNKREVKWGESIKASCSLLNTTDEDKKVSLRVDIKRSGVKVSEEEYVLRIKATEPKLVKLSEIKLDKDKFDKGKYVVRATLRDHRHDLDTKSTSFYLESKREPVKKGFIKKVDIYDLDDPTLRNKPVKEGTLVVNFTHKDFSNIWEIFTDKPLILNRQIGFYIIKLCLDEAIRQLLKIKLNNNDGSEDIADIIQEVKEIQDRMYYDVYA